MLSIILIILFGIGIYWFIKNKSLNAQNKHDFKERSDYFDEKFRDDYNRISIFLNRIEKLHEMLNDLIMLKIVSIIAKEDKEKWNDIRKRSSKGDKKADEEMDEWFNTTDNTEAKELHRAKNILTNSHSIYLELFQYWPKIATKYLNSNTGYLQKTLDDIFDASVYFDSTYSEISKKKLTKKNNPRDLIDKLSKLETNLKEILMVVKERYFEG